MRQARDRRRTDQAGIGRQAADRKAEGGARAGRADHADLPTHHLDQVLADHQSEAGASVDAGGGCVALGEGLEQVGQALGRDADAGVGDAETQLGRRLRLVQPAAQFDLAVLGELEGVGQQVEQDLAQADHVADHGLGHFGRDLDGQMQAFLLRLEPHDAGGVADGGTHIQRCLLQLQAAGFDF
ncbi:hypothetical protein D9M68_555520 [compost metagenome]